MPLKTDAKRHTEWSLFVSVNFGGLNETKFQETKAPLESSSEKVINISLFSNYIFCSGYFVVLV